MQSCSNFYTWIPYQVRNDVRHLHVSLCPIREWGFMENAPSMYPSPFTIETAGCAGIIPSPSTGEGGVGVIFIFR